jgi:phosphatidate cytidylyltransferase
MRARVISAAILAPLAIGLTIAGGVPFMIGVIVMCGLASWEVSALFGANAGAHDVRSWRYLTVGYTAALLAGVGADHGRPGAAQAVAATVLVSSLLLLLLSGPPARRALWWACGAATLVYVVGMGSHFVLLREAKQGLGWTVLALAVTWGTDIGAFFAGRRFGKHPFFSAISPKKTLEGALGGLLAGVLAAMLVVVIARLKVPLALAPVVGMTVSASAQAGDLVESLLKREADVKDSGTLIPGHGGILDRIDSLLLAVTITYYWRLLFP